MADFFVVRKSTAEFTSENITYAENQRLICTDIRNGVETDTGYEKMGNGVTPWVSLPYVTTGGNGSAVYATLEADFPKTDDTATVIPDLTFTVETGHLYRVTFMFRASGGGAGSAWSVAGNTATISTSSFGQVFTIEDGVLAVLEIAESGGVQAGASFIDTFQGTWILSATVGGTVETTFRQTTTDPSAATFYKYSGYVIEDITPV